MLDIKTSSKKITKVHPHGANKNLVEIGRNFFKKSRRNLRRVKREERKKEKNRISRQTHTRSLMHQSFRLFALAISPRFKHSADVSAPFFLPFDTCTLARHCRLLHIVVSVRYPFPEYFAPSTHTHTPCAAPKGWAGWGRVRYTGYPSPLMYSVCTEVLSQRLGQHGIARLPRRYAL